MTGALKNKLNRTHDSFIINKKTNILMKNGTKSYSKMKKILYIIILFLTVLTSCKKTLDIDSARVVGEKNMWNKLEDTRAGLLGIYALTRAALSDNDGHWLYGDVRTG